MRRITKEELCTLLVCPECNGKIRNNGDNLLCVDCDQLFLSFRGKPVLIRNDNEMFPPSAYLSNNTNKNNLTNKVLLKNIASKMIPTRSLNLARESIFVSIAKKYRSNCKILVVGCGNQNSQIERIFSDTETVFLYCDIDKNADVDVFCDSHCLPFAENSFDGVITTAVLEHVLYPDKVVLEIYKTLKNGGFIYSEIPFLQSVHEGAYDFTRFTMSGHRRLLEYFKETDSGIIAGPGTALVWSIDDFFKSLSTNRKTVKLLSVFSRVMFFWLKYFDYITKNNPNAINSASCTYFFGIKLNTKLSPTNIIDLYEGTNHEHV